MQRYLNASDGWEQFPTTAPFAKENHAPSGTVKHQTSARSSRTTTESIRSHLAFRAAINLTIAAFANQSLEHNSTMKAPSLLTLPCEPSLLPFRMPAMPETTRFRTVPLRCFIDCIRLLEQEPSACFTSLNSSNAFLTLL